MHINEATQCYFQNTIRSILSMQHKISSKPRIFKQNSDYSKHQAPSARDPYTCIKIPQDLFKTYSTHFEKVGNRPGSKVA